MMDPFGPHLKQARRRRGVSQERLAELAGMDRGHISKIEAGKIRRPTDEVVQRLADALGMTADEVEREFRWTQEGPPVAAPPTRDEIDRLRVALAVDPSQARRVLLHTGARVRRCGQGPLSTSAGPVRIVWPDQIAAFLRL